MDEKYFKPGMYDKSMKKITSLLFSHYLKGRPKSLLNSPFHHGSYRVQGDCKSPEYTVPRTCLREGSQRVQRKYKGTSVNFVIDCSDS